MSRLLLAGWLLVSSSAFNVAFAHQDRIIPVAPWGSLWGVPDEYKPAKLLVNFNAGAASPISSVTVVLGKNTTVLPECFTRRLPSTQMKNIDVGASWYHDEKIMPYYLWISFYRPSDDKLASGPPFRVTFNLRTGNVLDVFPADLASCVMGDRGTH